MNRWQNQRTKTDYFSEAEKTMRGKYRRAGNWREKLRPEVGLGKKPWKTNNKDEFFLNKPDRILRTMREQRHSIGAKKVAPR